MVSIKGLENEINKIKARNERVETEKSKAKKSVNSILNHK